MAVTAFVVSIVMTTPGLTGFTNGIVSGIFSFIRQIINTKYPCCPPPKVVVVLSVTLLGEFYQLLALHCNGLIMEAQSKFS